MNWLIAIPMYGFDHCEKFQSVVLPRLQKCLEGFEAADRKVRWIIHTDRPDDVQAWVPGAECIQVPPFPRYETFVRGHQEAWESAKEGEAVCFLCADLIPSVDAFFFSDLVLRSGKKAVVCAGIRTFAPNPPEIGASAEELLEFSMKWPHQITKDKTFGIGGSENITNVYFRSGDSAVVRALHLHPFAVVKQDVHFGGTVDDDLLEGFDIDEIFVVQNREMALVEMSPENKAEAAGCKRFDIYDVKKTYEQKGSPIHHNFIERRIRLTGNADCGDREQMQRIGIATV